MTIDNNSIFGECDLGNISYKVKNKVKKYSLLLLIIILSCSKAPVDDAANVVINYLTTTDEKKLHDYLDRDSIQYIETLKKDAGTMYPYIWVHHDNNAIWEVVAVSRTGNEAWVTVQCVKHKKLNAIGMTIKHRLIKENGQWKISLRGELPQYD